VVEKLPLRNKGALGPVSQRLVWSGNLKKDYTFSEPCKGFSLYTFSKKYSYSSERWNNSSIVNDKLTFQRAIPLRKLAYSTDNLNKVMRSFCRASGLEGFVYNNYKSLFYKQLRFFLNCIYFVDSIPYKVFRLLQRSCQLYLSRSDKWKIIFSELRNLFTRFLSKSWPLLFRSVTFLRVEFKTLKLRSRRIAVP